MRTVFKIFELIEISAKDEYDYKVHTATIAIEWDGEYATELEAIEILKECKGTFEIRKVFIR